jgi:hypothetical protein
MIKDLYFMSSFYSHIWENSSEQSPLFLDISLCMNATLATNKNSLKRITASSETPISRNTTRMKVGRKAGAWRPGGGGGGSRREAKQRIKHHVNTATANSIVLRPLSSPPQWQRTCGRWCHARNGAKFDWWVVACPALLDLSHVYAPI